MLRIASLFLALATTAAVSAPWIAPTDLHLRADLQRLAEEGVITVPLTTYPLMWSGIRENLQTNADSPLSDGGQDALLRVRHRMNQDLKSELKTFVHLNGGTETPRFQQFGSANREKAAATVSAEYFGERFAGKLSATYAHDPLDDEEFRLDGSYASVVMGNWIATAGMIEQWYGPSMNSSLLMSTNARPLPGIHLTRNNPRAFETKWLSWIGPWTLTTGVSWMDDDNREIEDALLYTFRATIKPLPQLELGASRAAQLCGDDRPCDGTTWWDMLTGDDNQIDGDQPGNQMGSIDMRWGDTAYGVPYSIYVETMGEDAFGLDKFPPFQAKSWLYGSEISYPFMEQQIRTFIEYSDTSGWCGGSYNCTYEHHLYKTGMRYNKRTLGSTYDNDTRAFTLGNIGFAPNGHQWKLNGRYLQINFDDSNDPAPGGNQISDIAENAYQLEGSYILPLFDGRLEVSADVTYSDYDSKSGSDTESNIWIAWSIML